MEYCRTNSTCSISTSNTITSSSTMTTTTTTTTMMMTPTTSSTSSSSNDDDYDQIHTLLVPYNNNDDDEVDTQQQHKKQSQQQKSQVINNDHNNDDTLYRTPKRSSHITSNHNNEERGTSLQGGSDSSLMFDPSDSHCENKTSASQQQQQPSSSNRFGNRIIQTIQKHQQNIRYRRRRRLAEYEAAILQKNNYYDTNIDTSNNNHTTHHRHHKHHIHSKRWKYIIRADHPIKLVWDFCTVIVSCIHAYKTHTSIRDRTFDIPYTNTIQILIEIWFIIDILLNFITEHRLGNIPLRTISAISARYLTTWFVIDILSLIPGEWLFVRPVIQRLKQRGRIQKLLSRYKAITRVTTKLIHRWTMIRQVSVVYRRQMGIGGVARLIRVLIRYIPKYILFLRNMKAVVAVRILRQWHWMRKVYYNIFVAIDVVYNTNHPNNNSKSSSNTSGSNYRNESMTITDTTPIPNPSLSHGRSIGSTSSSLRQHIERSPVLKQNHGSNGNLLSTLINDPISVVGLVLLPMNNNSNNNNIKENCNHDMVSPNRKLLSTNSNHDTAISKVATLNDPNVTDENCDNVNDTKDNTSDMDDAINNNNNNISYVAMNDDEFLQHSRVVLFNDDDDDDINPNDSAVNDIDDDDDDDEEEEEESYYFDEEDDDDDDDDGPY